MLARLSAVAAILLSFGATEPARAQSWPARPERRP